MLVIFISSHVLLAQIRNRNTENITQTQMRKTTHQSLASLVGTLLLLLLSLSLSGGGNMSLQILSLSPCTCDTDDEEEDNTHTLMFFFGNVESLWRSR